AGESLQVAYFTSDQPSYTQYLTKLQQDGVKAYLQVDGTAAKAGNTAALVSFINTYKSNPAVAGWLLYDEPEFNGVASATLVTDYAAIKAADPNHPVALIFGNGYCSYLAGSIDANFFNAADTIMYDNYPIHTQVEFGTSSNGKYHFTDVNQVVNDCL